jgi:hypothetical protein
MDVHATGGGCSMTQWMDDGWMKIHRFQWIFIHRSGPKNVMEGAQKMFWTGDQLKQIQFKETIL